LRRAATWPQLNWLCLSEESVYCQLVTYIHRARDGTNFVGLIMYAHTSIVAGG